MSVLTKLLIPEPEYRINREELGLSHEQLKRRLKTEYAFGYMGQDVVFWSIVTHETHLGEAEGDE